MKVIKCSDETYAFVCRVAAERKTYLADAVDFLVFKQGERLAELGKVSWLKLCQEADINPTAPNSLRIKHALGKLLTFADEGAGQPLKQPKTPERMVEVKES